jgi:hypothetical protein
VLLGGLVAAVACTPGSGFLHDTPSSERTEADAFYEAAELCSARVSARPHEDAARERRLAWERQKLASGWTSLDEAGGNIARIQSGADHDCLDQVLTALSGDAGALAVSILREVRVSCERDGIPPASSALGQCIHQRKLEVFERRRPVDGAGARETLDRLLQVGGGAPLTEQQRVDYCRTRELSGPPLCD